MCEDKKPEFDYVHMILLIIAQIALILAVCQIGIALSSMRFFR